MPGLEDPINNTIVLVPNSAVRGCSCESMCALMSFLYPGQARASFRCSLTTIIELLELGTVDLNSYFAIPLHLPPKSVAIRDVRRTPRTARSTASYTGVSRIQSTHAHEENVIHCVQ